MVNYLKLEEAVDKILRWKNIVLGIASTLTGVYCGFSKAQNTFPEGNNLEFILAWWPVIVQGTIDGVLGATAGSIYLTSICQEDFSSQKDGKWHPGGLFEYSTNRIWNTTQLIGAGVTGVHIGGMIGFFWGATKGAFETLIGYGVGYPVGFMFK